MFNVVDLFSGAGGMSFGFHAHPAFKVVGAADAQIGKPSSAPGSLGCNRTYKLNIGIAPVVADLATADPLWLMTQWGVLPGQVDVLAACPPCTGFTRTTALNHINDDPRNSLVGRVALFAEALAPRIILLENARELAMGRHRHHLEQLTRDLKILNYSVLPQVHMLTEFGLPQFRERAIVIAVRDGLVVRDLEDLWAGFAVNRNALTVRRTISRLPKLGAGEQDPGDSAHVSPSFTSDLTLRRIRAIPRNGGSWIDLVGNAKTEALLNPAHQKILKTGRIGSHPDVYGRMWWDEPARTIKRECSHVGNGRYSHPEQDRMCTVREMGLLQGFPSNFQFDMSSLSNAYRHIGDAVPPMISFQLAWLAHWILTGKRPNIKDTCLPRTSLRAQDILAEPQTDDV